MVHCFTCCLALCAAQQSHAPPDLGQDIKLVSEQGAGTKEGRAAWKRLANGGPELLPHLLGGMDTKDIVAANWLRTAFDRVFERALKSNAKNINVSALIDFAKDAKRQGRARRFALSAVERLRPGFTESFITINMFRDPEFRNDAIDRALKHADAESGFPSKLAIRLYSDAFKYSRDIPQAKRAAAGLLDRGIEVSVAKHLGFLTEWYMIGPFDAPNKKGFATTYPPENKIDLKAVYKGQSSKVRWKRYSVREPSPKVGGRHVALVNFAEARALGNADDAVAFAYTEINTAKPVQTEFCGAADDNLIVSVNGKKVFGFEEYQNGVRFDRHRFPVRLKKGKNTILVKVCQSPPYIAPNWEFILRIADATGKGIEFTYLLPKNEKNNE